MYCEHFGLARPAFQDSPGLRFYFPAAAAERALTVTSELLVKPVAPDRPGVIIAITARAGLGKTLLARKLVEPDSRFHARVLLASPPRDRTELIDQLCDSFAVPVDDELAAGERLERLRRQLAERTTGDSMAVVVMDDAHRLSPSVLMLLATLVELHAGGGRLLKIVLIGDPRLEDQLASPAAASCRCRVGKIIRIGALSAQETHDYLRHRLTVAGHGGSELFRGEASARIHHLSRGVPRLINQLADAGLLSAFSAKRRQVNLADLAGDLQTERQERVETTPPIRPRLRRRSDRSSARLSTGHLENECGPGRAPVQPVVPGVLEHRLLAIAECLSVRIHHAINGISTRRRSGDRPSAAVGCTQLPAHQVETQPQVSPGPGAMNRAMTDFGNSLLHLRRLGTSPNAGRRQGSHP